MSIWKVGRCTTITCNLIIQNLIKHHTLSLSSVLQNLQENSLLNSSRTNKKRKEYKWWNLWCTWAISNTCFMENRWKNNTQKDYSFRHRQTVSFVHTPCSFKAEWQRLPWSCMSTFMNFWRWRRKASFSSDLPSTISSFRIRFKPTLLRKGIKIMKWWS